MRCRWQGPTDCSHGQTVKIKILHKDKDKEHRNSEKLPWHHNFGQKWGHSWGQCSSVGVSHGFSQKQIKHSCYLWPCAVIPKYFRISSFVNQHISFELQWSVEFLKQHVSRLSQTTPLTKIRSFWRISPNSYLAPTLPFWSNFSAERSRKVGVQEIWNSFEQSSPLSISIYAKETYDPGAQWSWCRKWRSWETFKYTKKPIHPNYRPGRRWSCKKSFPKR